jgi:hypothetical protein
MSDAGIAALVFVSKGQVVEDMGSLLNPPENLPRKQTRNKIAFSLFEGLKAK